MNADIPAEIVLMIAALTTLGTVLVAVIGMVGNLINAHIGASALLRESTKTASLQWSQERATALATTAHDFLRALTLARERDSWSDPSKASSDVMGYTAKLSAFDADLGRQALALATEKLNDDEHIQKIKAFSYRVNRVCAFEAGNLRGESKEKA